MNDSSRIHKSAGILIKDRQVLIEKSFNKEFYNAPGGSIEAGETAKQALIRELKEEFDITVSENDLREFATFQAQAANDPGKPLTMDVFFVDKWAGEIRASNEVDIIKWVNSETAQSLPIGSITQHETIPKLKSLNLID